MHAGPLEPRCRPLSAHPSPGVCVARFFIGTHANIGLPCPATHKRTTSSQRTLQAEQYVPPFPSPLPLPLLPTPVSSSVPKNEVLFGSSSHCYFRPCSSRPRTRTYSGQCDYGTTPQARRSGILFLHCAQHGCPHVYKLLFPPFTDLSPLCSFDDGPYNYMVLPRISSCLLCSLLIDRHRRHPQQRRCKGDFLHQRSELGLRLVREFEYAIVILRRSNLWN